ncbi:MAG: hypothetical protein KatS3mg030_116 [Saprospiraceae bacterium]|nr:MAG: hypothetical protein KatS3mg030_116 [Saprospiraceae bacterium]
MKSVFQKPIASAFQIHPRLLPANRQTGIPRFHDSTIPRFHDSTIPRFHDSTIPRFHDLKKTIFKVTIPSTGILLLLILFTFSMPLRLFGDNETGDICGYSLEVCTQLSGLPTGQDQACLAPGCFRYYYNIYLRANNSQSYIQFEELSVMAELQVQGQISQINVGATVGCLNSQFVNYLVSPEPTSVGFYMPDESSTYYYTQNRMLLFTIVVDAFPGETVDVVVDGVITYPIGMGTVTCQPLVDNTCGNTQTNAQVTLSDPAACTNACISFGQQQGGGGGPVIIPVNLDNVSSDIEELDVKITVTFDNLMKMPTILGGDIATQNVRVIDNGQSSYVIYASQRDISNPTGQLFRIQIDGPEFESSGGTATLTLNNARYEPVGGSCCKPCLGEAKNVEFPGYPNCTEDITFRVDAVPGLECDDIELRVTVDWTDSLSTRDFYKFVVDIELETEGDVSVVDLKSSDIPCPAGQSYCGGNTCFQKLGDNRFLFCLWTYPAVAILKETGFTVNLDAPSGCVTGVKFRQAYLDLTGGGSGVACVPKRYIDLTDFPKCNTLISGTIERENGEEVEGTYNVSITSTACNYTLSPSCEKMFAQCVCDGNAQYTVTPAKDDNWTCGVTTFDLVLISKHILGIQLLDSPYKIIAADANNNRKVSTVDIVELRKLILNITEKTPNNTSWRFIDAAYQFPDPSNPFVEKFPESILVSSFPATADFVAVKVGDVNLSCSANCFGSPAEPEQRTAEELQLGVPEISAKKGEVFLLPFYWNNDQPVDGLQMGIRFDPAAITIEKLVDAGTLVKGSSVSLKDVDQGLLRLSWVADLDEMMTHGVKRGDLMFAMQVRAAKDLDDVARVLELDDGILQNEAYGPGGIHFGLSLSQYSEQEEGDFIVHIYPNPSSSRLTFEIIPHQAGKVNLMLFDSRGVRIWHKALSLHDGKNTVEIENAADLPPGVLMWKLVRRGAYSAGYLIHN